MRRNEFAFTLNERKFIQNAPVETQINRVSLRCDNMSTQPPEKKRLEDELSKLTKFEQNLFNSANAEYEGDYQLVFDALNANYQLDSMDYRITHQTASFASTFLNQTDIAIERLEQIFNNLPKFERSITNQSYFHLFQIFPNHHFLIH